MAATALLKFRDALNTGANGQAFLSEFGQNVVIENSDNTDVLSWRIWLVYAPPGTAREILPGIQPYTLLASNPASSTPTYTLTNLQDGFPGCYRIMLEVFSASNYGGVLDVDIRNIAVLTPQLNYVIPPYQLVPPSLPVPGSGAPTSKPNELNFGGQPYGWAGGANPAIKMQDEALRDLEGLIRVPPMEGTAESALAMDAVADGYFANAFGFDGTYTWVGFREYNEHVGKWVRFSKALNYVERHEYTAGTNSTVAALVLDEARSRMLEVLVYDSGGGSYVAEIITHTLATPPVAGTPVSLGAASGGSQSITVLPAGDYIFVFGLPGGTKRLLATDLTVQVFSAIEGIPHRMFYDPTDRYGDGEGRVYTQPAYYVYLRWVPSTGANDAFFQPEGEYNLGVVIGIDPTGGRMWAVWEKTGRNHLGSWDLHPFGNNLRFIAPAGEIGEPGLPHDWMFGGIVDGTVAYSIAQQSAPSYCYYIQKFTDSGAAIVEGAQVSDGATSLDAYDPQYLFLNVFNAFRVSLKAGSKMLTLVQSYSSRDWCVRALELSPMADALEDFETTEIGWSPVARVGGDLSGRGDNPKVTGIGGRNLNDISGSVPGEQMLMPPSSGQSMVFSFTPYTTRVGAHTDPTEAVGHPFTGFDVYRTNDDDPLTLQVNETAYLHPRTLHLRDVKGNAGHLGSHVTVEPYGTEEIKFGDMGFVPSFLLRSAYEEVVLSSVPGAAPYTSAWQVAERHRLWEGIDVAASLTVKSGYALCKVDSSGGAVTVTLLASPQHDDYCIVKDVTGDASTNNITVDGNSETIDGQATQTIAVAYGYLKLRYDGVSGEWQVVSEHAVAGVDSDGLVKVSADDTGAGYLEAKLVPGFGVEIEVLDPAGAESLEVGLEPTSGDTKSLTTNSILGSLLLTWDGTHLWGIPKSTLSGTGYLRFSPTDGSFLEEVPNYPDGYVTQNLVYETTLDRIVAVRVDNGTNAHYLEAFSKAIPSVKTTGTSIFNPYFTLVKMIAGGGYIWLHLEDGDDGFIYRVPADLSTSTVAATLATDFDLLAFDNSTTRYGDGEGRLFYSVSDTTIGRLKPSTLATDATFSPISGTGEILCMYVHEAIGRIWCAWVDDGDYYIGVFDCDTLGANLRSAIAVSHTIFNFVLTAYWGVVALCSGMPTQMVRLTDTGAVIDQYTLGYAYCETYSPAPGLRFVAYLDGHTVFPVYDYSTSRVLVKCWRGITEDHSPVAVVWEDRQDQLVKVDQYDGIGGFLVDKLAPGSVSVNLLSPANGMRQLQLSLNQSLASLDPLASGDNADVTPTDWDLASVLRVTSVAAAGVTGLAALTGSGKTLIKKLYHVGSYNITLKHQNAGSLAANRLIIPGGADLVMSPDDVVDLFYDTVSQRWRIG